MLLPSEEEAAAGHAAGEISCEIFAIPYSAAGDGVQKSHECNVPREATPMLSINQ